MLVRADGFEVWLDYSRRFDSFTVKVVDLVASRLDPSGEAVVFEDGFGPRLVPSAVDAVALAARWLPDGMMDGLGAAHGQREGWVDLVQRVWFVGSFEVDEDGFPRCALEVRAYPAPESVR